MWKRSGQSDSTNRQQTSCLIGVVKPTYGSLRPLWRAWPITPEITFRYLIVQINIQLVRLTDLPLPYFKPNPVKNTRDLVNSKITKKASCTGHPPFCFAPSGLEESSAAAKASSYTTFDWGCSARQHIWTPPTWYFRRINMNNCSQIDTLCKYR